MGVMIVGTTCVPAAPEAYEQIDWCYRVFLIVSCLLLFQTKCMVRQMPAPAFAT